MTQLEKLTFDLDTILKVADINKDAFKELKFKQGELEAIFDDYLVFRTSLVDVAQLCVNISMKFDKVHSVRYRIKNPYHLIAKIIRKRKDFPERSIDVTNYTDELKDIIGMRILHLFKFDIDTIDKQIKTNFKIVDGIKPIIFQRKGDDVPESDAYDLRTHERGYRSVHYIIESTPTNRKYYVEIQVRTIFEEGWSEVDHKLLYPSDLNNDLLNRFSKILNSLSGSADSMSELMNLVKLYQTETDELHREALLEKEAKIKELEDEIKKSDLSPKGKEIFSEIVFQKPKHSEFLDWIRNSQNVPELHRIDSIFESLKGIQQLPKFDLDAFTNYESPAIFKSDNGYYGPSDWKISAEPNSTKIVVDKEIKNGNSEKEKKGSTKRKSDEKKQ